MNHRLTTSALTALTLAVSSAVATSVIFGGGQAAATGSSGQRAAQPAAEAATEPAAQPATEAATEAAVRAAAVSNSAHELVYTPVLPCRIADTSVRGGKLAPGEIREFRVRGTANFTQQGAKVGGCQIPDGAVAATLSFTTSSAAGGGRLTAWARGTTEPDTYTASYLASARLTNEATVRIFSTASAPTSPHIRVHNRGASTNLIIEVTGFFAEQIQADVWPDGAHEGGNRVLSVVHSATGVYRVKVDRATVGCSFQGTVYGEPGVVSFAPSGPYVDAIVYSLASGTPTAANVRWAFTANC